MKTKISIATILVLSVLLLAGCQSSKAASEIINDTAAPTLLTEAEARDIALKDVGISVSDVTFLHVEKEADDGITKYDVSFQQGDYEYDYEIDAATGKIIGFDKDLESAADTPKPTEPAPTELAPTEPAATTKPTATTKKPASTKLISKSKAQSVALNHAGLKASEVSGLRVSLDKDDGRTYYEVDFRKGNVEYDYEIDAVSGKVVEWDKDIDD